MNPKYLGHLMVPLTGHQQLRLDVKERTETADAIIKKATNLYKHYKKMEKVTLTDAETRGHLTYFSIEQELLREQVEEVVMSGKLYDSRLFALRSVLKKELSAITPQDLKGTVPANTQALSSKYKVPPPSILRTLTNRNKSLLPTWESGVSEEDWW